MCSGLSYMIVVFCAGIRKQQDIRTAVVSNIFDGNGELAAGVASVEAVVSCFLLLSFWAWGEGGVFLANLNKL